MKTDWKRVWRSGLMGFVELLMSFPVFLLLHLYVIQGRIFWLWAAALALVYTIGCLLRIRWPSPNMLVRHIVLLLISAALSWLFFGASLAVWISIPIAWLALVRGGRYALYHAREVFPTTYHIIGIIIYFIVSAVARLAEGMQPIVDALTWLGLLAIIVSFFMINRNVLDQESLQGERKQAIARSVVWKNRVLIIGFAVVVGIVALFEQIREAFMFVMRKIAELIVWFLTLGGGEEEAIEPPAATPEPTMPPIGEPQEPGWFWVILEQIAKWAVLIAGIAVGLFLLYKLGKLLVKGLKALYAWLMGRLQLGEMAESDEGYEDEVVRLADWRDIRNQWAERIKSMFEREQREQWQKLPNNFERIRFLYRTALTRMIHDGYSYKSSLTPRETKADANRWKGREVLQDELVRLYEQARYGGSEPSDEEVAAVKRRMDGGDR